MASNSTTVQSSFQVDPGTAEAIEELKGVFGVTSNTAVIRKAIALARVAARNSNTEDRTVTLIDNGGDRLKISLAG
jgi:ribosomal protein L4